MSKHTIRSNKKKSDLNSVALHETAKGGKNLNTFPGFSFYTHLQNKAVQNKLLSFLIVFNVISLFIVIPGYYFLNQGAGRPESLVNFDGIDGAGSSDTTDDGGGGGGYGDSGTAQSGQYGDSYGDSGYGDSGYGDSGYGDSGYGDAGGGYGNSYGDSGYGDSYSNSYGDSGYSNAYGDSGSVGTLGPFTQNPPLPSCAGVGQPHLRISWTAATNVGSYRYYFYDQADGVALGNVNIGNVLSFDFTGSPFIPGHKYSSKIRAANNTNFEFSNQNAGNPQGIWSDALYGFTTFPDCNPPAAFSFSGSTVPACQALNTPNMTTNWSPASATVNYYLVTPKTNNLSKDTYTPPAGFSPDSSGTLVQGLLSYWKMDEAAGTNMADIISGRNGTANGTAITTGKIGNGRQFANNSSDIVSTNAVNLNLNDISISAWVKPAGLGPFFNAFAAQRSNDVSPNAWNIGYTTSYQLHFNAVGLDCTTSYGGQTTPGAVISPNAWNHVVVTRSAATGQEIFYVNGAQVYTAGTPAGGLCKTAMPINFGRFAADPSSRIFGVLDEVGIWNKVLSGTEVNNLYNAGGGNSYAAAGGGEPNGLLQPIQVNNPPAAPVTSYTHTIPGAVAGGETWQYGVVAYNNWGSTSITGGFSAPPVAPVQCAAPALTYTVTYTPVSGPVTTAPAGPFVTAKSNTSITLNWSSSNANSCSGSNNLSTSQLSAVNLSQGPLLNPPDALKQYTLTCTNTALPVSEPTRSVTQTVGVFIKALDPFLQTTQGDVHSNKNITVPPLP